MPLLSKIARTVLTASLLAAGGLTLAACGRNGPPVLAGDDAAEPNDLATLPFQVRDKSKVQAKKPNDPFFLDPIIK